MPASNTVSSGSGSERIITLQDGAVHISAPTPPVHSPTTSDSRSYSSSAGSVGSSEGWTRIDRYDDDDDIDPSDSASRSRHPARRHTTTEPRPAPTRRHSSRRELPREEIPRRSSHRHHVDRDRRERRHTESRRRVPSDESASTVDSHDDYPYSHHGPPPPRQYPGYRHVPTSHGGYAPSMASGPGGYPADPFNPQALVHMPQDPFGYPPGNPFGAPPGAQSNPFSPLSSAGGSSYFEPMGAPPHPGHHQRPAAPQRPQSYAGYSHGPGSELMQPYGGYAQPPYPPYGHPAYPQYPHMYPPSHSASPAPKEEKKPDTSELDALKALIQKHEEERVAREKAMIAKAEADAAAAAAAKAREEEEKKKKEEIADATKKAKEAAEKDAAEKAKKAKEESDKKMDELKKKQEEAEKKKKELEAEVEKNKPTPDSLKAPIKFKDAVGRKFSFPWHLCKTWKGMESLIRQAFLHVDVIGQHVQEGHYDLTGPDGEIILPQVWDTMIKPDWEVSMHMWPMPEPEAPKDKLAVDAAALADPFASFGLNDLIIGADGKIKKPKKSDKKKAKAGGSPPMVTVPVGGPSHANGQIPMPPPPPPGFGGGILPDPLAGLGGFPPGVMPVFEEKKKTSRSKSKSSKDLPPLAAWIAGSSRSKKGDEKLELVHHKSNDQAACAVM